MTVRKRSTIASPVNLLISLIIFSFFTLFTYSLWKRPSVNAGGLFPCLRAFFQGGGAAPPGYVSGFSGTGNDTPLSSAQWTRPRRHGAGSGVKVRQSRTFTGNFMRRSAERLSCLFCRRQNAAGACAQRAQKRHAVGVPFSLTLFLLLFYSFSLSALISRRKARASGGHFRRWRS